MLKYQDIKRSLLTPAASVGITLAGVSVVCMPFPGRAQSVLTCVTCASAVWLVDWMNIGWVSSCPAGIVTCCIWYNCCKTETGWRYVMLIGLSSNQQSVALAYLSRRWDMWYSKLVLYLIGYLSVSKLVELLLSLLHLGLCDLKTLQFIIKTLRTLSSW